MINILSILESLDNDPKVASTDFLLARFISSSSPVKVFIGTDKSKEKRYILIKLSGKWSDSELEQLPRWDGMVVEQLKMSILNYTNSPFLLLYNQKAEDREIFEVFMGNICNKLLELDTESILHVFLKNILQKWKMFFSSYGKGGLSNIQQRGLFGELWFLNRLIDSGSHTNVIEYWQGVERKNHDFVNQTIAVEIKTSISSSHRSFKVSSEIQLDDTGLDALFLTYISIGELNNTSASLPAIVEEIRSKLSIDLVALGRFEELLLFAGYLEIHSKTYTTGYVIRDVLSYHVNDDFPRILVAQLPVGVSNVTYSVDLSACESHKTTTEKVIVKLCGVEEQS
ncbi:hypothetical protein CBW65_22575 [Tumebacillus avium]|uniref:PD-(D/E)XK motif protein n=1 Tax=Tumebacillus avium TaxID=1903704 RepID=A0A1Y0IVR2_9BACL|nr:PD-(D/E)XK motif protein [Tumebacillus avium]ARU63473.1 hypothetical protein CBW65_22575 [Tumebacillus avium]